MDRNTFHCLLGKGPLVATAIHDGHGLRREVAERIALSEAERLHEEDPYTGLWTSVAPTRFVGLRSRFEADLNRPREKAVYLRPEDCWGLKPWREPPPPGLVSRSLREYEAFYLAVEHALTALLRRHETVIVLDLHSYNHRRGGPGAPPEDPAENPDINIGTGSADRSIWGGEILGFIARLASFDFLGRRLDVRENVKFQGGHFPQWIHQIFSGRVLAIAVELKKFWMDEWTGAVDERQHFALGQALRFAAAPWLEARRAT